jgi:hypothetical protein
MNTLKNKDNRVRYIVTTKKKEATEILLKYYDIKVNKLYAYEDIKAYVSKGQLISNMLDESNIKEVILINDTVEYLDSVKDSRFKCFF